MIYTLKVLLFLCYIWTVVAGPFPSTDDLLKIKDLRDANPLLGPTSTFTGWARGVNLNNATTTPCNWQFISCATKDKGIDDQITQINFPAKTFNSSFPLVLPASIFAMKNLVKLIAPNNVVTLNPIPDQISGLGVGQVAVIEIDLSANPGVGGPLPDGFAKERNILNIKLQGTSISGALPDGVSNPQLEYLDLSGTLITDLPKSFYGTEKTHPRFPKKLAHFDVSNCISLIGDVPTSMVEMVELNYINVYGSGLSGVIPPFPVEVVNTLKVANFSNTGNKLNGPLPQWMTLYTGALTLPNEAEFQCPIPQCVTEGCTLGTISSTLKACKCTCNSNDQCVAFTNGCNCPLNRYAEKCDKVCPGSNAGAKNDVQYACNNHGKCGFGAGGDGRCTCDLGFRGDDCGIACPGGVNNTCSGKGICDGTGKCVCDDAFTGTACSECHSGYAGSDCKTQCPGYSGGKSCSDKGTCDRESATCVCLTGYYGDDCSLRLNQGEIIGLSVGLSLLVVLLALAVAGGITLYVYYKRKQEDVQYLEEQLAEKEKQDEDQVKLEDEQDEDRSATRKSQIVDMTL